VRPDQLRQLLEDVSAGKVQPGDALGRLRHFPSESIGFAQLDHHRELRQGHPEVVFCEGKTVEQVVAICERFVATADTFLGTRASPEMSAAVSSRIPGTEWNPLARTLYRPPSAGRPGPSGGRVLVVSAGTSDLPVAEEAAVTAEAFGHQVGRLPDVGVAGLHRLLGASDALQAADVVIVAAGMEGALPSVVGGLVRMPVIAVPTSVGYGASFGGLAALLAMLNSCAAGVTVVNIDNGFGAAVAASRILAGSRKV
jgi:pyridinium-3,5-biscarboxylic acid mononucleotide synthase